jgi:hypothetical protein|eukprot:scaffold604_cov270-Chaetoceros_neogracile.AAC.3
MNANDFIKQANIEHDALSEYCNSLSTLSHRIGTSQETHPEVETMAGNPSHNPHMNASRTDPALMIHMEMPMEEQNEIESELIEHTRTLRHLQTCHSKLIQTRDTMEKSSDNKLQDEMCEKHVRLSQRVLASCASTNSRGYGPLYENGLLKNLIGNGDDDWHEIRLVSLVALRASIEKMKIELEYVL